MLSNLYNIDKIVGIDAEMTADGLRVDTLYPPADAFLAAGAKDSENNGLVSGDHLDTVPIVAGDDTNFTISEYMVSISGKDHAIFRCKAPVNPSSNLYNYRIPYNTETNPAATTGYRAALAVGTIIDIPIDRIPTVNACFVTGTLIKTDRGEVPVESLAIGDRVRTLSGALVPIKWIGRQRILSCWAGAHGLVRSPVVIKKGALGDKLIPVPHTDLYVSEDHAIFFHGILINAGALVGSAAVRHVPFTEMPAEFVYYHLETEQHEVILANGAPVESFVDNISRDMFDNYPEYAALYGVRTPEMEELSFPRVMSARQIPDSIRNLLSA